MDFKTLIKNKYQPRSFVKEDGLDYWREKIFLVFCLVAIFIGSFLYVPGLITLLKEKAWVEVIIYTLVYAVILANCSFNFFELKYRMYFFVAVFYILGIFLLILFGPFGAGFFWLIVFQVLTAILFDVKTTIIAIIINLLSTAILGFLLLVNPENLSVSYSLTNWITLSTIFLVVCLVTSLPVAFILRVFDKTFKNERSSIELLEKENTNLLVSKTDAEKADKMTSRFITNMSHEIRTPMNGILGFIKLLKNAEVSDEKKKRYLDIVEQRSSYLLKLINNIIDISMIESDEFKADYDIIDLGEMLDNLYEMFASQLINIGKKVKLGLQKNAHNNVNLISDQIKIQQVLINLLGNAVKFTDKGSITFGYDVQNNFIKFFVNDTGVGISEPNKKLIFKRFTKIESSSLHKNLESTGLGLSISKGLVKLLGGDIWFESEIGKGSTFYFTIPRKENKQILEKRKLKENITMSKLWKENTILVVEDDEVSTEFLKEILIPTGVKMLFATDGNKAVEICRNEQIDVVLMDIRLPTMSGNSALVEIKKFNKRPLLC